MTAANYKYHPSNEELQTIIDEINNGDEEKKLKQQNEKELIDKIIDVVGNAEIKPEIRIDLITEMYNVVQQHKINKIEKIYNALNLWGYLHKEFYTYRTSAEASNKNETSIRVFDNLLFFASKYNQKDLERQFDFILSTERDFINFFIDKGSYKPHDLTFKQIVYKK